MSNRVVEPELLDALPGQSPAAIRSRADLRRLNWWMRNERHVLNAINSLRHPPATIVEAGSGDGTFLLALARRLAWKHPVQVTLLDMQPVISLETLRALRDLGWHADVRTERIQDWLEAQPPAQPNGEHPPHVDLVLGNLFWHHLSDDELRECFTRIAAISRAFIACEPRRWLPSQISTRLLLIIGCSAVTLHDARVSVDAGFREHDLTALWPTSPPMNLTETDPGWASHLFVAQRE